ncbi:ketopantoate reductase family protein [Macrococcoides canis]|uniref:ketopantoate reductase family protein n=1 Tax=Macrococcoides canis TaxID=1855823 RepID=UPI001AEC1CCF|nr:2-dehydropantoate 2-reductase [Macrococcus canis]MCO4096102.1 2-dehydropantoate 2-reductase [Macrococcus canis]QTQ08183.1 2-dehydropantoate 2-reductase [Macrococcus canis]QUR94558.1 2-dehydropantoate 2-reductase [Macrococcus canis]UTH02522.1 2-dehydropantoate 2-reductase [Macrococcus canis]UTH06928.1 2-dehydropantoate 2-reductase [Macrococcus canis]
MYKIAIAGAGAMGGRIGTYLKRNGEDVVLIDRWQDHIDAINKNGMEIQTETETYTVQIPAMQPEEVKEKFDLIILLTKAMHADDMLKSLKDIGAITESTAILSMMNGLGHADYLSQYVPKSQIFLAVTMWTAGLRGPGQLLLEGQGGIDFQRSDGQPDERTEKIAQVLDDAGLNAKISDDVFFSIWSKAAVNSVLNPLCTILDKTIGEFGAYENAREMITPILKELVAVANARGTNVEFETLLAKIEATYPNEAQGLHHPSMHQDYTNKRLTEIDYLNGQIAKYGDELGIETPANDLITHLIHQLEMKYA